MTRSLIQSVFAATQARRAVLALSATLAVAMLAVPLSASAQTGSTVTFTNPNCTGYALTGTPPNQTLTCITGSGPPTGCQITGPTAGTVGTTITLTSACTGGGAATSWVWTGGTCQGITTQSCAAVEATALTRTYTVTASNGSGAGTPVASQNVVWGSGGGGPSAPSGCTLTPANQQSATAAILGLTAQCTAGTLPITHAFSGAIVGSWQQTSYASGIFIQNNYTASTSVSVSTSNSVGPGNSSSASIVIGSGSNGALNCTANGFTSIIPNANFGNAAWGVSFSTTSTSAGIFGDGATTAWVYKMTVPAGTGFTNFGRFTISEYAQGPTPRQLSISTLPCDFRPRDITGAAGPLALCSDSTTCEVYYGVTGPSTSAAGLTAGTTYYISARNWQSPGQSSCGNTTCNALMEHHPPQ